MEVDRHKSTWRLTARPGVALIRNSKIDLTDIMAIDAKATVFLTPERNEQVTVGFVQVLDWFCFKATYNLNGIKGADITRTTTLEYQVRGGRSRPYRDALPDSRFRHPWYDAGKTHRVVGTGLALKTTEVSLHDSPSGPDLASILDKAGWKVYLTTLTYELEFTTWLACFNHTIAKIFPVAEAKTSMRFHAPDINLNDHRHTLPAPTVISTDLKAPETRMPLVVWTSELANDSYKTTWATTSVYDQRIDIPPPPPETPADLMEQLKSKAVTTPDDAEVERKRKMKALLDSF